MSSVYFAQCISTGLIKIGVSVDVTKRIKQIEQASCRRLSLLGTIPGNISIERRLHKQWSACREMGEWFAPNAEMLASISEMIAAPQLPLVVGKTFRTAEERRMSDGLIAFLRERHPVETAERISVETGIRADTVSRWLAGRSLPRAEFIDVMIGVMGPSFLAAILPCATPEWISNAIEAERSGAPMTERERLNNHPDAFTP